MNIVAFLFMWRERRDNAVILQFALVLLHMMTSAVQSVHQFAILSDRAYLVWNMVYKLNKQ